jgi:hypothetical protein
VTSVINPFLFRYILSSYLYLVLPSYFFPLGFLTKTEYAFLISVRVRPVHLNHFHRVDEATL